MNILDDPGHPLDHFNFILGPEIWLGRKQLPVFGINTIIFLP